MLLPYQSKTSSAPERGIFPKHILSSGHSHLRDHSHHRVIKSIPFGSTGQTCAKLVSQSGGYVSGLHLRMTSSSSQHPDPPSAIRRLSHCSTHINERLLQRPRCFLTTNIRVFLELVIALASSLASSRLMLLWGARRCKDTHAIPVLCENVAVL